ncbi:hypothetical protein [Persephonella sp.]
MNDMYLISQKLKNSYEDLKKKAIDSYKIGDLEKSLSIIVAASTLAMWYHFGCWSDDDIEELIKQIVNLLLKDKINTSNTLYKENDCILFLTSYLSNSGGHTRAMKLWINCLSNKFENIYLISTEMHKKTSLNFPEYDILNKVKYQSINNNKYSEKIRNLVELFMKIKPKYVFLFITPNDVVSISALSYLKPKLSFKTIFFNHSDHTFWLGKNIIDLLVEFRAYSARISRLFRNFQNKITAIPLSTDIYIRATKYSDNIINKTLKSLDIEKSNYKTISLSIGASWKFVGNQKWNYFRAIKRILEHANNHIHMLITNKKNNYIETELRKFPIRLKDRFKIIYNISDPIPYYKISDFIIESFPITGGTVRLEAMALGKPIIFIKHKESELISFTEVIPENYKYVAKTEEELVNLSINIINNKKERKKAGEYLRLYFFENFSIEKICRLLENVMDNFDDVKDLCNQKIQNMEIAECNEYLLFMYDINYRGLINPYLILLKVFLEQRHKSLRDYYEIIKNLSLEEVISILRRLYF